MRYNTTELKRRNAAYPPLTWTHADADRVIPARVWWTGRRRAAFRAAMRRCYVQPPCGRMGYVRRGALPR